MNFTTFQSMAYTYAKERSSKERVGQALYTFLAMHNKKMATSVVGKADLDPFYNDKNIPAFLKYVQKNWNT